MNGKKLAFNLYFEAAQTGLSAAQYNLADMYLRGAGVSKDRSSAIEWFEKASQTR